jgi:hypothetical protein
VFVATLLFRGLGKDVFQMIPQELRELYRLLKRANESDPDDITRFHAQIALAELGSAIQEMGNV